VIFRPEKITCGPEMLSKPCRKCGHPGTYGGICGPCEAIQERARGTRQARGFDSEYDRNRAELVRRTKAYNLPCWLCGLQFAPNELVTADHVRSRVHGGSNALSNLRPAHARCNSSRGGRTRGPTPGPIIG
jgi:5-methylcytosine-specific restriction endonuclease McrA